MTIILETLFKMPMRLVRNGIVKVLKLLFKTKRGREIIFLSYYPNKLLVADSGNERFIVNSSDKVIGYSTFVNCRAHDVEKLESTLKILSNSHKRKILVDIGANIGTIGIHAVANGMFERCVAFEPEPRNFRLLCANIALNGLQELITAHNIALSDGSISTLEFELSETNFGDHRVRFSDHNGLYNEASRKVITVLAKCLDDFEGEIDLSNALIWMDTQGFEGYVLVGAKSFMKKRVPLVTEFWPYGMHRSGCLDNFIDAILDGCYSAVIDLSRPEVVLDCKRSTFVEIAKSVGDKGKFTDLLIS